LGVNENETNEEIIKQGLDAAEQLSQWPNVTMGIFIEKPTPFLREFFQKINKLNYPKEKISVVIHNNVDYHKSEVLKFVTNPESSYAAFKFISLNKCTPEHKAREEAV
jgi:procollagen-lysine,2-oxoglutarate 5-dioxygenase